MENLSKRLTDKSIEAFMVGLELYNKPTIKYRVEGFSFFICNSWELLLKSVLLDKNQSIYYKDNPERTKSLEEVIKLIYTDKNTKIRLNLEKIIELRNISTHFITEDYEAKYTPLFQACVFNYIHELQKFKNIDITDYVPQNFLAIHASLEPLNNGQIKLKYPPEIAQKLIQQANDIEILNQEYHSDKFAINIKQNLYITKKAKDADFVVSIANNSPNKVAKIKELKDPSDTHKYSFATVIMIVNKRLRKQNIKLNYKDNFNQYILNLIVHFLMLKIMKNFHIIIKSVIRYFSHLTRNLSLILL